MESFSWYNREDTEEEVKIQYENHVKSETFNIFGARFMAIIEKKYSSKKLSE